MVISLNCQRLICEIIIISTIILNLTVPTQRIAKWLYENKKIYDIDK